MIITIKEILNTLGEFDKIKLIDAKNCNRITNSKPYVIKKINYLMEKEVITIRAEINESKWYDPILAIYYK